VFADNGTLPATRKRTAGVVTIDETGGTWAASRAPSGAPSAILGTAG